MKYFVKISFLAVITASFLLCCTTEKKSTTEFIISGSVQGDSIKQLILHYKNHRNKRIIDTVLVQNGTFKIKGTLKNPQKIALVGNVKENVYDNPNIARFYIGYDDVELDLIEDKFNKTEVRGSAIQDEYVNLFSQVKPIFKLIDPIMVKKQSLIEQRNKGNNDSIVESKIKMLSERQNKLIDSIQAKELIYSWNHPNSYLSVDLISFYENAISKDSLKAFYNNLTLLLKSSFQAESIKELIDENSIELANVGDKAPNFISKELNDKVITLEQFKGKYVLLDFWAGWCVPCIKNHPELKRLYTKYHSSGLEIIGVSFDKSEQLWRDNIEKEDVVWNHIFVGFGNSRKVDAINMKYNIQPIPAYILIDKEGIIIGRYLNADSENKGLSDLDDKLKELLK